MSHPSGPHFSNPWTSSAAPASATSSFHHGLANPSATSQASTMSMRYSSLPATTSSMSSTNYSSLPYNNSELLNQPSEVINGQRAGYEQPYSSAPATSSSYAATAPSSYPSTNFYGHSLAHQQQDQSARRISPPYVSRATDQSRSVVLIFLECRCRFPIPKRRLERPWTAPAAWWP